MAGTIRNYYENCLPLKPHNQYCKLCLHSNIHTTAKLAFSNQACLKPKLKKFFTPYITHKDFNIVMEFHQSDNEPAFGCHLVILPVDHMLYFAYIDCLIINHKKRSWTFPPRCPYGFAPCHVFATFNFFISTLYSFHNLLYFYIVNLSNKKHNNLICKKGTCKQEINNLTTTLLSGKMTIEEGTTDRRLARYMISLKNNR